MNNNNIIVFDLETSGLDTSICEVLQIAAVAINGRNLTIEDKFASYCRIDNLELVTDEITKINGITKDIVTQAAHADVVWPQWFEWIARFNSRKNNDEWGFPIACGWNIDGYDMKILDRYAKQYHYYNEKYNRQRVFSPAFTFDTMKFYMWLTRTNSDVKSVSLGSILEYMGMSKDEIAQHAHNAIWDVEQTAALTIKILELGKYLTEIRDDGTRRLELSNSLQKKP
jgi:DNA polymerase III epsilon subunit-like protein